MPSRFLVTLVLALASSAVYPEEPIRVGDPLRCLRVLVGLSCKSPGAVEFTAEIQGDAILNIRVLPPMDDLAHQRVAQCIANHPAHFIPRFKLDPESASGAYRYTVTPFMHACPDQI